MMTPTPYNSVGGHVIYKCLVCGHEDATLHVPDIHLASMIMTAAAPIPASWAMFTEAQYHRCPSLLPGGTIGVMRPVGFKPDKKIPDSLLCSLGTPLYPSQKW